LESIQFDPAKDIFCEKVCTEIIESQFCIVLLADPLIEKRPVPNPNIYYEYGLMTGFAKTIIPLQREEQRLAFNVQSFDTIKYTPKTLRSRLAETIAAVIAARSMSIDTATKRKGEQVAARLASQLLELGGHQPFQRQSFINYDTKLVEHHDWYLSVGVATAQQAERAILDIRLVCERLARYAENPSTKLKQEQRRKVLLNGSIILLAVDDEELLSGIKDRLSRYVVPDFVQIAVATCDQIDGILQCEVSGINTTIREWLGDGITSSGNM
jgi:hypothetical protein